MNEDDIVAAIAAIAGSAPRRVRIGIGDDAAVWQPSRSHRSVITSDAAIEGVHFELPWLTPYEIGWRAMAANTSDVAAMGARPVLATITLGVPESFGVEALLECYRGLAACAAASACAIVGGDLTRAPALVLSITVVGEVRPSKVKTRDGMRPGDVLAVTGEMGASRAGLEALRGRVRLDGALGDEARSAYALPQPRVLEGRWLAAGANVHAMIDCSDGLSTDLLRMARASGCGITVDAVPAAACARAAAAQLGETAEDFALGGGEEYELVVAIAPRAFAHVARRFQARFGRPLLPVGLARADERAVVVNQGSERPLERTGWDHFG